MPLPIPDIMKNASDALIEAKKVSEDSRNHAVSELKDALKKINPNDILAVLNEIGVVYQGAHNIQISQMGSRPNSENKMLEILILVDAGMGPKTVIVGMPVDNAEKFAKAITADIQILKPGRIIMDVQG